MTEPREIVEKTPCGPFQLRLTMCGPFRISTVDLKTGPRADFVATMDAFLNRVLERTTGRYETMVFEGDKSRDLDMARYATAEEALAGHDVMVAKWRTHEPEAQS